MSHVSSSTGLAVKCFISFILVVALSIISCTSRLMLIRNFLSEDLKRAFEHMLGITLSQAFHLFENSFETLPFYTDNICFRHTHTDTHIPFRYCFGHSFLLPSHTLFLKQVLFSFLSFPLWSSFINVSSGDALETKAEKLLSICKCLYFSLILAAQPFWFMIRDP